MGGDGLVPPLEGGGEVVVVELLPVEAACGVGGDGLESGGDAVLAVLFGADAVELAVVVAGGFDTGEAHVAELLEDFSVFLLIVAVVEDGAYGIELEGHLLFGPFGLQAQAAGEQQGDKGE